METTATEAEDYEAIHAPYFESKLGRLEYGGTNSLLDGSLTPTSGGTPSGASRTPSQTRKATSSWATPRRHLCPAGDAQGQARLHVLPAQVHLLRGVLRFRRLLAGETTTETWQNTTACTLGQACAFDRIVKTTVPGCPAICRGMRIRAFEARAAHHTHSSRPLLLEHDDRRQLHGNCTAVDVINTHDIGAVPAYRRVRAPSRASSSRRRPPHILVGVWDAALELSLSSTSDRAPPSYSRWRDADAALR